MRMGCAASSIILASRVTLWDHALDGQQMQMEIEPGLLDGACS